MSKIDIARIIENVRHYLPAQGPIKDFIHHNTLHAFQDLPFDQAKRAASEVFKSRQNMPLSFFREKYAEGEIGEKELNAAVQKVAKTDQEKSIILAALNDLVELDDPKVYFNVSEHLGLSHDMARKLLHKVALRKNPKSIAIRPELDEQLGLSVDDIVNPVLFRIVGTFLDQGVTLWQNPYRDKRFFEAIKDLCLSSRIPMAMFIERDSMKSWLSKEPEAVVAEILGLLVSEKNLFERYVKDTLLAHPGWSGIVNFIENKPESLLRRRQISVLELLAFKLVLEWQCVQYYASEFVPLGRGTENRQYDEWEGFDANNYSLALFLLKKARTDDNAIEIIKKVDLATLKDIWQNAFEMTSYNRLLATIQASAKGPTRNGEKVAQAVFCIDDRECSFRRHLEEVSPSIETFGWAGFFGIDFYFQSLNDSSPVQMCPPIIKPKHFVKEVPKKGHESLYDAQKQEALVSAMSFEMWREASSSLLLGFLASGALGQISLVRLLQSLVNPQKLLSYFRTSKINVPTDLKLFREDSSPLEGGMYFGFTTQEMAQRVYDVLSGMGLTKDFAKLVVLVAHGSSSVNNPHFAAYDCGACSGKPGAPNARVFAAMANNPRVRASVRMMGICIPDTCWFLGGYHDTATDSLVLYDLEEVPDFAQESLSQFDAAILDTKKRNAKERCRRFAVTDLTVSEEAALIEVRNRTVALVEPRPELGHATNMCCIIGPRMLTKGVFLDRRAFLNSYDPTSDPEGIVLKRILSAVFPVCGGINLEYYFSRIDPALYGCGTKLSHNVCGLIGVGNGIDDDLRTGLPVQMTEVHDPLRLLVLINQKKTVIECALQEKALSQWVDNQWVHVASLDPNSNELSWYVPHVGFEKHDVNHCNEVQVHPNSLSCYQNSRGNAAFALIRT